jgi:hypothetical protein
MAPAIEVDRPRKRKAKIAVLFIPRFLLFRVGEGLLTVL